MLQIPVPGIARRGGWGRVRFHLLDPLRCGGWGCAPQGGWGAVSAVLILTWLSDSLPFSSWPPCSPLFLHPPLSRVSLALCWIPSCGCPPPSCVPALPPAVLHATPQHCFFLSPVGVCSPRGFTICVPLHVSLAPSHPPPWLPPACLSPAPTGSLSPWPCVLGLSPPSGA